MSNINKALFLDRDGVVNIDHGYVYESDKFEFVPGVFTACKAFADAGYKLIIVTNQSGIGRGYYSEADFHALTQWMIAQFAAHQVKVTDVYFCPHHPKKALPEYLKECDCRKPAPGMLLQGIADHHINPACSIMVGDKLSDMQAASKAVIGTRVLVRSGQEFDAVAIDSADHVCDSLADLPSILL
ncbi:MULTISPECIES: D-glycero-beta-D-manno-heptose 1,7-bisphosphate 7-phosphatase [Pseudoalteromonas]|uniref:D-glycero-beta-D-manno-heptose 1,7-bisphosphate 7-phosphatase n=1 Tax=Pseudoalteromonas TaxID=53246 RepID=UPI001600A8D3|nr:MULTISPECIES: D-glycero-beta-D-manno-heptose 1,7-bisphosphate 7-phosphatase [unclassified Pseudoalteromonas]MBB1293994.1 D-glycero-beta-D-manno-heptose 1,7-bisphosphate 7-phosphatase [Pseudoalteromonas sp. SR41-4]MBB1333702.1 D-glycero-beta-D-manno-heptose 1,7-bisphosphate 7-phosphatase [Pseudoalteromonas sp. SR41-6]MBB1341759.1 D-glycero-beta-D-manno-heptose 1,7-bisphosphate 7-phosphatase [Pseudoalteromonas sp. SR45-6]MBB1398677.1 D-glycero-beta-D-manno-heptose 1,7-bisphosphate 7-phosphatas|tara:strand:+ start:10201 stop:10755 length:555 start_codon:yes stop_codon:yes gene_type:complete